MDNPPFFRKYSLNVENHEKEAGMSPQESRRRFNASLLATIQKLITEKHIITDLGQRIDLDFTGFAKMTHTDYKITDDGYRTNRVYAESIRRRMKPFLNHYASLWGCRNFDAQGIWFAQYENGAEFGWHTHEGCNASAVYMLELPDSSAATEFWGIDWDEELNEGDLMVFPAIVPHRSPIISRGRKTIIGINGNINNCPSNLTGDRP